MVVVVEGGGGAGAAAVAMATALVVAPPLLPPPPLPEWVGRCCCCCLAFNPALKNGGKNTFFRLFCFGWEFSKILFGFFLDPRCTTLFNVFFDGGREKIK